MSEGREAWLPSSEIQKRVNLHEAIKNYCIAQGDEMYNQYVQCHSTKVDDGKICWVFPNNVSKFEAPIKDYLRYLYKKYMRKLNQYASYPSDAKLNLGLKPPTVHQFREMIRRETNAAQRN